MKNSTAVFATMFLALACAPESEVASVEHQDQALVTVQEPIVETTRGYELTVPSGTASGVPTDRQVKLALTLADGRVATVLGRAERSSSAPTKVTLVTTERLGVPLAARGTIGSLLAPGATSGCLSAEFGIGCWGSSYFAWCVGTTYCLPGPGPGGFVCKCL